MKYSRERLLGAHKKLSETDRGLLMEPATSETTWAISKKHNVPEKQKGEIVDLTSFVILKLDPLEQLAENISKAVNIDLSKASAIKEDLEKNVISKFENYDVQNKKTPSDFSENETALSQNFIEKTAFSISQKQKLSENQRIGLVSQINAVLSGKASASSFRSDLVQKLGVTYDQALKISLEVTIQIFESNSKTPQKNTEIKPELVQKPKTFIPDHEQMVKTDGPHIHSQNVMPTAAPRAAQQFTAQTVTQKPAQPAQPAFKSIVDQKLSGLVRSSANSAPRSATSPAPSNLPTNEKDLEEMMKKSADVRVGYKGIDPYREPIE